MMGEIKIGAVGEIIPERWATSRGISNRITGAAFLKIELCSGRFDIRVIFSRPHQQFARPGVDTEKPSTVRRETAVAMRRLVFYSMCLAANALFLPSAGPRSVHFQISTNDLLIYSRSH